MPSAAHGLAVSAPITIMSATAVVITYVATPTPICQPNPLPYSHDRYLESQSSLT